MKVLPPREALHKRHDEWPSERWARLPGNVRKEMEKARSRSSAPHRRNNEGASALVNFTDPLALNRPDLLAGCNLQGRPVSIERQPRPTVPRLSGAPHDLLIGGHRKCKAPRPCGHGAEVVGANNLCRSELRCEEPSIGRQRGHPRGN